MSVRRLDNVSLVVEDLEATVAFFAELGLELEGRAPVSGAWVDAVLGLEGVASEIALMVVPGTSDRVEIVRFLSPAAVAPGPRPINALGLQRLMFAVDDLDATVARLIGTGATMMGAVTRFEDAYLLAFLRGPEGIIVAIAQELGGAMPDLTPS